MSSKTTANSGRLVKQFSWDVPHFPSNVCRIQTPTPLTGFKMNTGSKQWDLVCYTPTHPHPPGQEVVWDLSIWPPPKSACFGVTKWWWLECPPLVTICSTAELASVFPKITHFQANGFSDPPEPESHTPQHSLEELLSLDIKSIQPSEFSGEKKSSEISVHIFKMKLKSIGQP